MTPKPHDRLAPLVDQARALRPAPVVVDRPVTAERIERAMVLLAFIITSTGKTKFAPLLERLERELAEYRAERDPMSRAARILRDYSLDGTGKAIR
jgi:hypothetical protein